MPQVVDQARAPEIAVAFHLAHARDDIGHRGVTHRHQIERVPDAALVFGPALVHPQRNVPPEQRDRDEVVLEDVRQLVHDEAVEEIRGQVDRQHHAVTLAFGERQHAFGRLPGGDVLLLELAVRLENDERHPLIEVVPQIGADMLVRALRVARDARQVLLVFRVVVDLEVLRLVDVPLELVVVDQVLAVVRSELRLRVHAGARRAEMRPGAQHGRGQFLRVRLTCDADREQEGERADGSTAREAHAHRNTSWR